MVNRYLNLINKRYQPRLKPRIMSTVSENSLNHKFGLKKDYVVFCPDANLDQQRNGLSINGLI